MKKINWRKVTVLAAVAAVIAIAVFYINNRATSRPQMATLVNPAFGEFISSYTAGVISSGSTIRITFSKDAVDSLSVGSETSVKLFDFTPSVEGTTYWHDQRTLEFRPSARLQSAQVYTVELFLSRLFTVPDDLATFEYSLQVIPQNFELAIENVKPYQRTQLSRQKIEGTLTTADFAEAAAVEKMMTAQQDNEALAISWAHTGEGRQHAFVIEEVKRKETASIVNISIVGNQIGSSQVLDQVVDIPALGDFKVTNVRVEQGSSQHVVIQFSDPLNESQNLEGLISINELSNLDFDIKDNEVRVYPTVRQTGSRTLTIEEGIRNSLDYKMTAGGSFDIAFEQVLPAVRFIGNGSILPSSDGLVMPFEAVNLKSVDVEILKIYERNVLQFLQVNNFDGNQELRRVGKPVLKKTISLENAGVTDLGKWNRFTLDLATLINAEPGAIYQVRVGFKRSYLAYVCEGDAGDGSQTVASAFESDELDDGETESSYWDSYEDYYYGEDYDWEQRDNPCHKSYYTPNRVIKRNIIASDLGLLAKRGGDGRTVIAVTDLKTTQPLSGVQVTLYDFQQQSIGSANTNAEGLAEVTSTQAPFAVVATNDRQRGYLKLQNGESLGLSSFDVGGEQVTRGLKGFLYGDRGVWRPGDSLFLSFILEDKLNLLPENHPVVFELENPQGQVANRLVRSSSENGFYRFATATTADAPTGNWRGRVKVGGTEFTQPIKIEMVKPNRLKINLDFGVTRLTKADQYVSGQLKVNWLHGAPGKNLKAQFDVLLTRAETKFEKFRDFIFDDPSREFANESKPVFEGFTDDNGQTTVNANLEVTAEAPGMLNAVFRGKVFEESGNFSIDRFSIPYYPFESFTGIRLPLGDKARGMLLTDTTHQVAIATVDADGNGTSRTIEMSLYKIEWRWWWDHSEEGAVNFMSGNYSQPISVGRVRTTNGKGTWNFKVKYPEWGRYFVKAYDPQSGHSSGKIVYIDWPGWAGRARQDGQSATMLSFASDKSSYAVGEKASLVIPGSDQGRALISLENGSRVIKTFWLETKKGDNPFSFEVTAEMTPNIFASVTLLQPHGQTVNDLPIRLYGVIPLQVEDPATRLSPVLSMPEVLEPGQEVVINVSEKNARKMTYTIAVVDEGLLDITRFKTPDPWSRFYAREALGVRTWDLFDQVMGSYGGKIERLLAIGGDGESAAKDDDAKANRFKPVVKFFGPFTLDGKTREHRFTMPAYIGSVKTMLVAGYDGAYGNVEKVTPVRKPLMVLATLPRVVGPGESVKLPVTIFSNDQAIRQAKVEVKVSGPMKPANATSRTVQFAGVGDLTTDFDLLVNNEIGMAKVEVTVTSGKYAATDIIDIEIRNPNPTITKVYETLLEPGQQWASAVAPVGMAGTNRATLEVSNLPPINLGQRLRYLLQYPYGCVEQTTSSVFPQLYLDQVKMLTPEEKAMTQKNIKAGIERLKTFVNRDGGFSYWPGHEESDPWGSTYAGHFLIEADRKGYFVPQDLIKRWKKYQRSQSQSWRRSQEYQSSELIQSYRLYTLALSGDADLGSMNRLREQKSIAVAARWMLAAAYAKAGQPEAAKGVIANLSTSVKPYQEMSYSYGSDLRDKAIILETLVLLGDRTKAFEILKEISKGLSNAEYWMSTQTISWCLKAAGTFVSPDQKDELKFNYSIDGKESTAATGLPLAQLNVPIAGAKTSKVTVTNTSKAVAFVRIVAEGIPARGEETEQENNLKMSVMYTNSDGNVIDPATLEQGTEFICKVTITNPGIRGLYKNLALHQIFPSGWEINNLRLTDDVAARTGDVPTYQDIRDDRVYTYFDLGANQQKTFTVQLTASYAGVFYLPAISCEAMYDRSIYSTKKGKEVSVVKNVNQ